MTNFNAIASHNPKGVSKSKGTYSHSVAFSHYNYISAQLPLDPNSGKLVDGGLEEQAKQCLENIKSIVESISHDMNDVVRMTISVKDIKHIEKIDNLYRQYFPSYLPARTVMAVSDLQMEALVQMEAVVSHGEGTIPNAPQAGDLVKLVHNTDKAPVNSLSTQTVAFSHYNNISAQLPINPETGRIIASDIKEQARQSLNNIKAILTSIDVPFDDIVKLTVHLKDLSDMDSVKEVYSTFFPDSAIARAVGYMPALSVVEVSDLPMNALIQVEAVVSYGDGTPPQAIEDRHGIILEANNTKKAPMNLLSTQTVAFSHYNHLSAQLPIDPNTNEQVTGGIKEQTKQCLENIKAITESVDHEMADVVKITIYLKDLSDLEQVDSVYSDYFSTAAPARSVVGVANLPGDALIQMDTVVSNAEGTPPIEK